MALQADRLTLFNAIARAYRVALLIHDAGGTVVERFSPDPESDEFLFSISNLKERLFRLCSQTMRPHIISSDLNQLWAGVPVIDGNSITRTIVVGPVHTSELSKGLLLDYVRSYDLPPRPREKAIEAVKQSPVCPYVEFTKLLSMIYYVIYNEDLDVSLLAIAGLVKDETGLSSEIRSRDRSHVYGEGTPYPAYDFEQYLTECIREGQLERLKRHLRTATYADIDLISNADPVRQQKDSFIILLALAGRSAMEGGLSPKVTYSLTDLYIQQVEAIRDLPPILTLSREMLYDFTTRVSNLKRTRRYSKLINDCCDFIDEHVRENLRVTTLAARTGFNAHHIAKRFRDETGQTISSYIKQAKIDEAKSLLRYSDLPLAEISEVLSFSSQSFFTATFRQITGLTPGQYREKAAE